MNKSHGVSIQLLVLSGVLALFRDSEACNAVSSIECVNSTHFLWCIEDATGTLVTIGDAEACPGTLVCDDTQTFGCVSSDIVTTIELTSDSTTAMVTTTELTSDSTTAIVTTTELTSDSTMASVTTTESISDSTTGPVTTSESFSDSVTATVTTTVATTDTPADTTFGTDTTVDVTHSTAAGESSIVSDADFTCIYEGLYRAQDCSRFHVCYKFIWFIKHYFARCSEGLYWSSSEKRCVLRSISDCP